MAKLLKDILRGVKSSTKKVNNLGGYAPKAGDEADFAKKHEIEKHADRAGNGDDVFNATNVKHSMASPKEKHHGYKKPEDAKVNESKKVEEAKCNMTEAGKNCPVHGMSECMTAKPIKEAAKTGNEGYGYHGQAYNAAKGNNKMAAADKAYSAAHSMVKKHAAEHLKDVKNPNKMVKHYLDSKLGRHLHDYLHSDHDRHHGDDHKAEYVKKDIARFKKTYKPEMHEEVELDEVLTKSTTAGKTIHDFVHSKDKKFSGDSKKQRIKRALGAYYAKQNEEVGNSEENFNEASEIVEVNHRDYGAKGKMHPDMAKNMKVGQHVDFYSHGTGDKQYGMVTKNTGTAVHVKADKKTHKFSVTPNLGEDLAVPLLGGDNDNGVSMVKAELKALANKAMHLVTQMPESMHVEPWVQAKIAQAKSMVSDVHDYLVYGDHDKEKETETADTPMTFPGMSVDVNTGQNV
jgi:hypothetical protein